MQFELGVVILSLFCAGGLVAYVREALRLRRLLTSGRRAVARVLDTREDSSGSESVTHYLVRYEFEDAEGHARVHEQDLNSKSFFDTVKRGDELDVLYESRPEGNSYPVSQVRSDLAMSCLISAAIVVFWAVMAAFLELS
jgi:hypothetical protein